ncbi:MAG: FGGY family carbohydrate kinase [Lachnospiraceae bacterium]|jgi:xylulokinase|nr:FGGY family carbohydrate kinase [Lachnospiraceae bacterium]
MLIGGLDIGTTGCKLTVFDGNGNQIHRSYREYPSSRESGAHEIDAGAVLEGALEVIKESASAVGEIAGIGITSFGETFVMTDEKGKPLHRAMLYTDPRGKEQCMELCEKLGAERICAISGMKPHEMYSLPKIMWMKENCPEIYKKTKYIFLMEDFLVFHLTGMRRIDYSLATRTMGFDIRNLVWSREIFEAAGIDSSIMSKPVPTGSAAGNVSESAAAETGLSVRTKIVCISHDQIAAAVGAGVFDSDTAVDGAGTVECLTPVYDGIPDMNIMMRGNYAVVPYVIPGKYVCYAFSYTGGALIQWCVDTLTKKEKEEAKVRGISVNELLEGESASPTGLLVLPHFAGAATPYMDTGSRGAILGLTTATTAADIYRGCMEGVAYEMMLNLEYLKDSGIHFRSLRATGGGAHSKEWMQMKADILDLPITSLETADAGTVGSAMLTGIASGCFRDLSEASKVLVREIRTYAPRKEMHEQYMEIYGRYRELYQTVRKLMKN